MGSPISCVISVLVINVKKKYRWCQRDETADTCTCSEWHCDIVATFHRYGVATKLLYAYLECFRNWQWLTYVRLEEKIA